MSMVAAALAPAVQVSHSVVSARQCKGSKIQASFGSVCVSISPLGNALSQYSGNHHLGINRISHRLLSRRRIGLTICEVALKAEGAAKSSKESKAAVGSKIRVKGPLKVYHVPKNPEFELGGMEGEIKSVLYTWKGKTITANLPYKVQFFRTVDGKEVKFVAHLREDEFEVIG